ncbi:MAG: 1-acyl-sn-glycerol-3-phosphate acyltransferase [archaeon]|nr:1-acyl-sn-glycerol-3-phosphate acyltransferase [archaeon]
MDFLKDFILEPIDNYFYSWTKILNRFGVGDSYNKTQASISEKIFDPLLKNMYKYEIFDGENITMTEGRAIICANFQSIFDPIVVGQATHKTTNRVLNQVLPMQLFQVPFLNSYLRAQGCFPIRKGEHKSQAYTRSIEILEKDGLIGVLPEKGMNPGGGRLLEPTNLAAMLSYQTSSPIIPMAICGTDRIYGKGAKMPKTSGKIMIRFGTPMNHAKLFGTKKPDNPKVFPSAMKKVMRVIKGMYFDMLDDGT